MTTLFKLVHNVETGEITQVDLTAAEIAELNDDGGIAAEKEAEANKKAAALAKLEALGLDVDDLAALGL